MVWETLKKSFLRTQELIDRADQVLNEVKYESAVWTRQFINSLPNAAFAAIEKGYKDGDNKGARHLPHHNSSVKSPTENSSVDLPHYRNALARVNQIKPVLGTESAAAIRKRAANHLAKHRAVLNQSKADFSQKEKEIWMDCEILFEKNVRPLLDD